MRWMSLSVRENLDRTRLTSSSFADPLQFASLCWRPLFCLFSEATLDFLLVLLFARNSPFYVCPLLSSFVFLSPYSAYFGVLSNFLARFSGLASIAPLPPPSPFHYVMAKIVPVVQLAAHAKSSTLYGRTVVQPNFFGLMGWLFRIIMGLRWSSAISCIIGHRKFAWTSNIW